MKKLIPLLLALSLAGCASLQKFESDVSNIVTVIGTAKVNSKSAYVAISVFNAAERSVANYLRLPLCNGSVPACQVPGAAFALDQPFNDAIKARVNLRAWMKAHPGTFADAGLYDTLVSATSALQKLMSNYSIGGPN